MRTVLNRRFKYTYRNAVGILIALNFIVFGITGFLYPRLIYTFSLFPLSVYFNHAYYQFLTYMFTHSGFFHLAFNMLALFFFGTPVEKSVGTREFTFFYLLSGILTGCGSYVIFLLKGTNAFLLGASGAVFAVLVLFSVLYPKAKVFVFGLIPMPSPLLVFLYIAIEMIGLTAQSSTIAHSTHLLGVVFALLYAEIRMRINPIKAWMSSFP